MAFKILYDKNALQDFKKQLAIRKKALPVLKHKETALRNEIKELQKVKKTLDVELEQVISTSKEHQIFWSEFPDVIELSDFVLKERNVVGVRIPEVSEIHFSLKEVNWLYEKAWIIAGIDLLKRASDLRLRTRVNGQQISILQNARKKTTQKVNLYEKVQIPNYEEAIVKIQRFLEDKENIAKAAQKIVKNRNLKMQMPAI